MIIYKAVNLINGKIYIGKTVRTLDWRIKRHCSNRRDEPFARALRKYGTAGFDFAIIDEASNESELAEKERYWIKQYGSHSASGYNLTDGGEGSSGFRHRPESKMKMSVANKGRKRTPEAIRRTSEANTGRKHTVEELAKMSVARRKRVPPMLGKHHSMQTREKMKAWKRATGRRASDEVRRKMSEAHSGERAQSAKLREEQVLEIRRLFAEGGHTQTDLALRFHVNHRTIHKIVKMLSWKNAGESANAVQQIKGLTS